MAVWPDPAHGKCSYGYFKIPCLIFQKVSIFEIVNKKNDYAMLDFCFAVSRVPEQGASVSELGASATAEKHTHTWILEHGICGFCAFSAILSPPR